eukprot:364594-Chlamydomonas_euryale.AAC.10
MLGMLSALYSSRLGLLPETPDSILSQRCAGALHSALYSWTPRKKPTAHSSALCHVQASHQLPLGVPRCASMPSGCTH